MLLTFEDRASSSPFVERVWRCFSNSGGPFYSMAESNLELVVTQLPGLTQVTLRGPVTRATTIDCPPHGQWVAIRFRAGTYFPALPTALLLDHRDVNFPLVGPNRFWLEGAAWEIPSFENAETLVERLARSGVIAYDPAVGAAIAGDARALTIRSVQRHFLYATGITHVHFKQIERARHAVELLQTGSRIRDVVHAAGYYDHAHLTRSLARLIGQTPTKILHQDTQLSFLYKTGATAGR